MPLGEQPDQNALDELVLADDDAFDLEDRPFQGVHLTGEPIGPRGWGRRGPLGAAKPPGPAAGPPGDVIDFLHSDW